MVKLRSHYLNRYKQDYIWVEASAQHKERSSATPNYELMAHQLTFTGTDLTGSILIQNLGWILGFERDKENQFSVTAPIADILFCAIWSEKPFVNVKINNEYFKYGKGGKANGPLLTRQDYKDFFKLSEDREETLSSEDILIDHTPSSGMEIEMNWNGNNCDDDLPPSMENVDAATEKNHVLNDFDVVPLSRKTSTSLPTGSVQKEVEPRPFSSVPKPSVPTPSVPTESVPTPSVPKPSVLKKSVLKKSVLATSVPTPGSVQTEVEPRPFSSKSIPTFSNNQAQIEDMDTSQIRDDSQSLFTQKTSTSLPTGSVQKEVEPRPFSSVPTRTISNNDPEDMDTSVMVDGSQSLFTTQNQANLLCQEILTHISNETRNQEMNNQELNNSNENPTNGPELENCHESMLESLNICKMKIFEDRVECNNLESKKIIPILDHATAEKRGLLTSNLSSLEDRQAKWDSLLPPFNVLDMMDDYLCEKDETFRKRVRDNDSLYLVDIDSLFTKSQRIDLPIYYEEVCKTPFPTSFGYGLFDESDKLMPFTGKTS